MGNVRQTLFPAARIGQIRRGMADFSEPYAQIA
jgi:hypothetical protein